MKALKQHLEELGFVKSEYGKPPFSLQIYYRKLSPAENCEVSVYFESGRAVPRAKAFDCVSRQVRSHTVKKA